jgi:hypothetical protein
LEQDRLTQHIWQVGNVVEKLMGQAMDPDKLEEVLHKLDKDGNGEVSRQGAFADWKRLNENSQSGSVSVHTRVVD